jgi:hypothetical protein
MDAVNKPISVIEPVNEALEKTKILLFRPFNLEKWFIIGFCAWLANLIRGSFYNGTNIHPGNKTDGEAAEVIAKIVGFVREHIIFVSISASLAIILLIAIFLLYLWLSSRGQFMFLDCLAKNKAQINEPWKVFKRQANSLLGFRLLVMIISFAAITALSIPMVAILALLKSSTINGITAFVIFFVVLLLILAVVSLIGLVQTLTTDFVVPIMYLQRISVLAGWRKFLPLLWRHFWKVMLYLAFKLLISICIGAIVVAITFIGCCCLCGIGIIFFIPYVSTVVTLPFHSFSRLYALCFFKQFGSEFDVFAVTV